jgi:SOS response regulatory protein OraA/RecX
MSSETDDKALNSNRDEARNRLLFRISRRETCQFDALKLLKRHHYTPEIIDSLMSEFTEKKWIDDNRYFRALVRELSLRGKGPRFIVQKLKEKQIRVELRAIEEELTAQNLGDEDSQSARLLARKFQRLTPSSDKQEQFKIRQKAMGFLVRRGFSIEAAKRAFESWLKLERE